MAIQLLHCIEKGCNNFPQVNIWCLCSSNRQLRVPWQGRSKDVSQLLTTVTVSHANQSLRRCLLQRNKRYDWQRLITLHGDRETSIAHYTTGFWSGRIIHINPRCGLANIGGAADLDSQFTFDGRFTINSELNNINKKVIWAFNCTFISKPPHNTYVDIVLHFNSNQPRSWKIKVDEEIHRIAFYLLER
jgi:hypothetical protein